MIVNMIMSSQHFYVLITVTEFFLSTILGNVFSQCLVECLLQFKTIPAKSWENTPYMMVFALLTYASNDRDADALDGTTHRSLEAVPGESITLGESIH